MSLDLKIQARDIALGQGQADPVSFVLKNSSSYNPELLRAIGNHLAFRQGIQKKIPKWYENERLISNLGINIEQSSSEITAAYKASFASGSNGLDLTGGLGVDSYFLSSGFKSFIHNEPNQGLSDVVRYNFSALNIGNVTFTQFKGEDFPLDNKHFDWIYLDPSRRDNQNSKLFKIEDCLPNLIDIQQVLIHHSDNIMVKYSPMLDIKQALAQLESVSQVWVLSEKNEVKELVFILNREKVENPVIKCVNLGTEQSEFLFTFKEEKEAASVFSEPLAYLYEPNSSILKGGAFNRVGEMYHLKKIAPNSHLYTSDELRNDFPGRIFKIEAVTNFDRGSLNEIVTGQKANISCRNFPLKPEEVRKKLKWKDGGDIYVFLTANFKDKKTAIVTKKV